MEESQDHTFQYQDIHYNLHILRMKSTKMLIKLSRKNRRNSTTERQDLTSLHLTIWILFGLEILYKISGNQPLFLIDLIQ